MRETVILRFEKGGFLNKHMFEVAAEDANGKMQVYHAFNGEAIEVEVSNNGHYWVFIDNSSKPFTLIPGCVYHVEAEGGGFLGMQPRVTRIR